MSKILVIGYGNPLRRDEALARLQYSALKALCTSAPAYYWAASRSSITHTLRQSSIPLLRIHLIMERVFPRLLRRPCLCLSTKCSPALPHSKEVGAGSNPAPANHISTRVTTPWSL